MQFLASICMRNSETGYEPSLTIIHFQHLMQRKGMWPPQHDMMLEVSQMISLKRGDAVL